MFIYAISIITAIFFTGLTLYLCNDNASLLDRHVIFFYPYCVHLCSIARLIPSINCTLPNFTDAKSALETESRLF